MAQSHWIHDITRRLFNIEEGEQSEDRYSQLRRKIVFLMVTVTLVPLTLMAFINYYQYRASLEQEVLNPLRALSSKTKHSFELFLEEKLSNIKFIASAYNHQQLEEQDNLNHIFRALKSEFEGFIDMGYINCSGIQTSYVGPYDLLGRDYADQAWYHEVRIRDVYISDVFMGYRNFPHIAIAVQLNDEACDGRVLRATIDTQLLDNLIAAMQLEAVSDAFIINDKGEFQTNSKFYGKVLEHCPFTPPPGNYGTYVAEESDPSGQEVLVVYNHFTRMGFSLVLIKPRSIILKNWFTMQGEMVFIYFLSSVIILIMIFKLSEKLVRDTREADQRRELAYRELEHNQKLSSIGRLAAGVAHEINNPLAIINEEAGLMNDLIERYGPDDLKEKYLRLATSIQNAVMRCKTITQRLLGFARRMEVQFELLNVNDIIHEVLGFLGKEHVYRNLNVKLELAEDLPEISADVGLLQQAFLNIISNAFDAVEDNGEIVIRSWDRDAESIGVTIRDNGCGMDRDTISHIFEPFFTTKRGHGTGLGLPITYGIVKKLGGDLKVRSTVGEGTTFELTLLKESKVTTGDLL